LQHFLYSFVVKSDIFYPQIFTVSLPYPGLFTTFLMFCCKKLVEGVVDKVKKFHTIYTRKWSAPIYLLFLGDQDMGGACAGACMSPGKDWYGPLTGTSRLYRCLAGLQVQAPC
jgi:hypothetical protein